MSEQLTEGERTVLGELLNLDQRVQTSKIANNLNQSEERVVSILQSLASRHLVKIITKEIASYFLTDEGQKYVESGLPEILLFKEIKNLGGKATISNAFAHLESNKNLRNIAMSWAIKNEWIIRSKEADTIFLKTIVDYPNSDLIDFLSEISTKGESTKIHQSFYRCIEQAMDRRLVTEKIKKRYQVEIVESRIKKIGKYLSTGV